MKNKEETTLSDKEDEICEDCYGFYTKDVREFIKKISKGCGCTFGDSYYKDMNPRICGKLYNKSGELRYCSSCRKWINRIKKHAGKELSKE